MFLFSYPLHSCARRGWTALPRCAEGSPRGEVVRANIAHAFKGESKYGPCYHGTVMKQRICFYERCIGPSMLLTISFELLLSL